MATNSCPTKTVLLVHGQWLTPRSWEHFVGYYEQRGFQVLAPAWPRMVGEVGSMRRDPQALAGLGLAEIVTHYEEQVRALARPPILVGHSLGGLIVQMLLDRGWGAAGVAIGSAAPRGVWRLPLSTVRAVSPVVANPRNYGRAVGLTFQAFRYALANTMSEEAARRAYERYAIAGPGRTIFQVALANWLPWSPARVDYQNNRRASLLLIAGQRDRMVPPAMVRSNHRKYAYATAAADYREFPGRSHLMIAEEGWQEVAECALAWAVSQARRRTGCDWQFRGPARSPATS